MVIRFGMESLSGLPWNPYPLSRGIAHRFGGEYTPIYRDCPKGEIFV